MEKEGGIRIGRMMHGCEAVRSMNGSKLRPWIRYFPVPIINISEGWTMHEKGPFVKGFKPPQPHPFSTVTTNNQFLDLSTKQAAITTSPSVVSLVSYSGNNQLFQCSGIIVEQDGTIFTSTQLITCRRRRPSKNYVLAKKLKVFVHLRNGKTYKAEILTYDFYYGITALRIQAGDVPLLQPACFRLVDDSLLSTDPPSQLLNQDDKHSGTHYYNLIPGDKVIALGRNYIKPYDLMAAPGKFSIEPSVDFYHCEALLMSTCQILSSGTGGPLINRYGEVIGISFYHYPHTSFLPINVALKWWEHHKKTGKLPMAPLLGMRMAGIYTTGIEVMEKLIDKFPKNFQGVIVKKVERGSPGDTAGICCNDLIVGCCGKTIRGFLEFYDVMWDNVGNSVQLVVLRAGYDDPLRLTMDVMDAVQEYTEEVDSHDFRAYEKRLFPYRPDTSRRKKNNKCKRSKKNALKSLSQLL